MNELESLAYLNTQIVCAQAEIEGMKAENTQRMFLGQSMAYDGEAFFEVIVKYGLHHNAVCSLFHRDI